MAEQPKDNEYTLEVNKDKKLDSEIPLYFEKLKLSDDDKKRLKDEIWAEFKEIKYEREKDKLDDLFDTLDNQYKGKLKENKARQFNIDRGVTAVKVDKIVSDIMKAFTKQDPKFAITPRPELAREDGNEICQRQSDFIDDRLDNLPFYDEESKVVHSAVLKGVGILKITHKVKREPRKRIERYEGKNNVQFDPQTGKPIPNPKNPQMPLIKNKGLEDFLKAWPDAGKKYPGFIKDLLGDGQPGSGKTIEIVAKYIETTYNDPCYESIDLKDFYCRKLTKGLEGLKTAKLIVERRKMSYWELKDQEEDDNMYDIDKIFEQTNTPTDEEDVNDYKNKTYDILECTYVGEEKVGKEPCKMKLWFEEETKVNIGAQLFPWFLIDSEYIPHYIMNKVNGFYQPGIGQRLTNNHISENAIINFFLEGMYRTNMVTPITENDEVADQFEDKKFSHGVPLRVKPADIDFLETKMKPIDYQGALGFLAYLAQSDDEKSRAVQMVNRGRNVQQPVVPLGETAMLMAQSSQGIEDFIVTLTPAFNEVGYVTLNLYYEISKGTLKYRIKSERIVGSEDIFQEIGRDDLIARTNIQVQAYAFNFDKLSEKKDNLAFMQVFLAQVLVNKNPKAVWTIIRGCIKSWSPYWRNQIDAILPPLEEMNKTMAQAALKAVATYMQQKQIQAMQAQAQGQAVQPPNAQELLPLIQQLQSIIATPQTKTVVKKPAITFKEEKKPRKPKGSM